MKKPYQVESAAGSKRFDTKAEAVAYMKREARLGRSSRAAGPNGPCAMMSADKPKKKGVR